MTMLPVTVSVVRIAPDSLLELSDYTRLSSGQLLTLVSLDRGMAYFTGQAGRQEVRQNAHTLAHRPPR